ncbi:MAG: Aerotolerance regulator N-terminal, partial [Candidatus Binatota bacterium]|nr:Aerotolerance regulator N-terminal [Candidatus Binatota bacterium]
MDFLNPGGLVWLAALPLLLVPYLLRERTRRRLVPALFLYEGIARTRRLRLFGVPRLEPLFWLQLLLLALLGVAIARPALTATTTRSALVLDDSASMQAPVADGGTRLDRARGAALEAIAADPAGIWDVFALSPAPRALGAGLTAEEARERASGLRAS